MNGLNLPMEVLIFVLVIGLGVVVSLVASGGIVRKAFLGWRTPTTWISALPAQGWVEVLGKIRSEPLKSPFGNSECGYWQIEVQEYQSRGRGGGSWQTIYQSSSGSFMLDDMTGRVNVLDGKATVLTDNQVLVDNSDARAIAFIESLGIKTTGLLGFKKRLRLYERVARPDVDLLVLGRLQKSSAPVTISGNDLFPLVISNQGRSETNKALVWQSAKPVLLTFLVAGAVLAFFLISYYQ